MPENSRRVLLVGHCGPDATYLRMTIRSADPGAQILFADTDQELERAVQAGVDLILFNRELDGVFEAPEGIEQIRKLRRSHPQIKTMLVSNYPEAQQAALAAGALPGFGKRQLGSSEVLSLLREALSEARVA